MYLMRVSAATLIFPELVVLERLNREAKSPRLNDVYILPGLNLMQVVEEGTTTQVEKQRTWAAA
jgi:hypothetical protein